MKKEIKFILILFISMIAFTSKNVYAATTLPQTYNQSGYEYSIDAVKVECYKADSPNNPVENSNKLKDGKMDVSDNEITINPTLQKGVISDKQDGLSIKLNLTMKQSFSDFVKNYLSDTKGAANYYVCFMKVDYKIKKVAGFNGAVDFKYLLVSNSTKTSERLSEKSGYYSKSQAVDVAVLKDSDKSVTTKYLSLDGKNVAGSDYMQMTDGEKGIVNKGLVIYVHDMTNFNKFSGTATPSTPSTPSTPTTPQPSTPSTNNKPSTNKPATTTPSNGNQQSTTLKNIPDTASNATVLAAIGAILCSVGSIVLLLQFRRRYN